VADLTAVRQKLHTRARQAQVLAAADMKTRYRRASPYKSGDTQESVDVINFTATGSTLTCTAVATTPQAEWTDKGTRPHDIRPRNKKALRFKVGGRTVFAKVVHHPGNDGTRWFSNTGPREWSGALQRAYQRLA
jgi:hypothetical protein